MKKLFIGFVLASFTFSISLANGCSLSIPPPFLGVALMAWGCWEMKKHSRLFGVAAGVGAVLAVLHGVEFCAQLTGTLGAFGVALSSLLTLLRLVFDLLWIWGVGRVEKKLGTNLHGAALWVLWILQFVTSGLVLIGLLATILLMFTAIGVFGSLLLSVIFAFKLFQSWKAWDYLERRGAV